MNTQCLLHGFYVLTYFLLATPEPKLHVTGLPTEPAPDDIRLHDFGLRYQFNLTCLSQIFRTVFAAQHVAHHYNAWTREHRTDSMELFARHAFHCRADVREVARMVRDGARLLQVEEATGSPFVSAIVALNWRQFEASTDAQVRSAFDAMLSRPSVSAIMTILSPQWMYRLFDEYHSKTCPTNVDCCFTDSDRFCPALSQVHGPGTDRFYAECSTTMQQLSTVYAAIDLRCCIMFCLSTWRISLPEAGPRKGAIPTVKHGSKAVQYLELVSIEGKRLLAAH